jgi:hypothetical protein
MSCDFIQPHIALPAQECEGARAWQLGTAMRDESMSDGFAFCPYAFGSLEARNWLAGYASLAFHEQTIEEQIREPEAAKEAA